MKYIVLKCKLSDMRQLKLYLSIAKPLQMQMREVSKHHRLSNSFRLALSTLPVSCF